MRSTAFYRGKRVVVTGSTGHLASNLIGALADTDCQVIRLSRPGAEFPHISGEVKVEDVTGDISDRAIWERVLDGADVVFHFAACTSYASNNNPPADLAINFTPMLHLLETCRHSGYRPMVLLSGTVTQTGFPIRLPVDETHPDNPITVYDLHKQMAENYLKYYASQGIVRGAILRLSNVYGPGPKASSAERGLLNIMTRRALWGKPLTVYGEGNYVRDFVYVRDVVEAFLMAGANIERLNARQFVVGSGQGHTIARSIHLVAERAALKTGRCAPVLQIDPPQPLLPIEARHFVADPSSFTQSTGWRPRVSLAEGIDQTIDYYLSEASAHH